MKKILILSLLFFFGSAYADSKLFLKDRPSSYCSIYTSTATKILSERLKGISKQNSIESNRSIGMGKKYNENIEFLANNIFSDSFDVSNFNTKDEFTSQPEKFAEFAISIYEKCLFDKYGIDPWNEYPIKN